MAWKIRFKKKSCKKEILYSSLYSSAISLFIGVMLQKFFFKLGKKNLGKNCFLRRQISKEFAEL